MPVPAAPPLPDYDLPPVIEVVIGTQFEPIEGFLPTHLGLFWEFVRSEYPKVEAAPPLSAVQEQFGGSAVPENAQIDFFSTIPIPRVFFIDQSDSWLIQLQPDRLLQNWRKNDSAEPYPRFPAVWSKFDESWKKLYKFCKQENLTFPAVNQLEMTYINHIPVGQGWNSPEDVGAVFPDYTWRSSSRFLPAPEAVAWKMAFVMPKQVGRLHVSVRQAIRKSDSAGVLLCELTARGRPETVTDDAISAWFELAREWIVRGFADLMSESVQLKQWGRKA